MIPCREYADQITMTENILPRAKTTRQKPTN